MRYKDSKTAYRIESDNLTMFELPQAPETFRIKENLLTLIDDEPFYVSLLSGEEDEHCTFYAIPAIRQIASRLTPWATWYLAPKIVGCSKEALGFAMSEHSIAVLSTGCRGSDTVISNAFHEAWHLCEEHIDAKVLDRIDQQLLDHGAAWPSVYLAKPCERRARAFAAFACALFEGARIAVEGPGVSFEIGIFWQVYSGEFGREMMGVLSKAERQAAREPTRLARTFAAVWGA